MSHKLPLADIQFISDFAVFARSKGDERYNYTDARNCATCQFLRETGLAAEPVVNPLYWRDGELTLGSQTPLPAGMDDALEAEGRGDWTFSALADRLEALIADAPVVSKS